MKKTMSGSFCWVFGVGVASGVGMDIGAAGAGFVWRRPDWASTTNTYSTKSKKTAVVRFKTFMWIDWGEQADRIVASIRI
jgi:hypothetical protein